MQTAEMIPKSGLKLMMLAADIFKPRTVRSVKSAISSLSPSSALLVGERHV
jgi:hypothetical protein